MTEQFDLTIAGSSAPATSSFPVVNPATGVPFAEAPACSKAQIDLAFDAALEARKAWSTDESVRRNALRKAASTIAEATDDVARILTTEQGKPFREAKLEVGGAAFMFGFFADLVTGPEVLQNTDKMHVEIVRRPFGVVAAITPWNFPVFLAARKMAPALLAGNCVVVKPSPYTPLSTLMIGRLLRDVFPPGVVNVVSGGDEVGAWMVEHPTPRKVSFTGSVDTGRRIAGIAAADLKRLTLELGGNDPAILLEDVDVPAIADQLFAAAFSNNGQICTAVKRVYVPESLRAEVVEALATLARATKVGDGFEEGVRFGPINNAPQLERVHDLVGDALAAGAVAVAGGNRIDRPGFFFAPTILDGATDGVRIVDEEQFGPALPVISYRDVDDAVHHANNTHFGLDASVWSNDLERAAAVADRLDCGTVWVNAHGPRGLDQPIMGHKSSGIGVENGIWGYHEYTEMQLVYKVLA